MSAGRAASSPRILRNVAPETVDSRLRPIEAVVASASYPLLGSVWAGGGGCKDEAAEAARDLFSRDRLRPGASRGAISSSRAAETSACASRATSGCASLLSIDDASGVMRR
jgi:hypothetical protein